MGINGQEMVFYEREYAPHALLGFDELPAGKSVAMRNVDALRPREAGKTRTIDVFGRTGRRLARGTLVLEPKPEAADGANSPAKSDQIEIHSSLH